MTTSTSAPQNRARPAGKSAVTPLREPSVIVDDLHVSYRVSVPGTRTGGVSAALPRLMRRQGAAAVAHPAEAAVRAAAVASTFKACRS